jgi:hypothetical protein
MKELDPDAFGNSEKVNSYCGKAMRLIKEKLVDPYNNYTNVSFCQHINKVIPTNSVTQHGWFDIAHPKADPFPEPCKSLQTLPRAQTDRIYQISTDTSNNTGCKAP